MPYSGPKWEQGRAGERAVKRWLQEHGYFVVPTADIDNGGAPMLEGLRFRAVLPDFLASMWGSSRWVEVKTKSRAAFYHRTQQWRHGFPARNWLDYQACEEQTGIPGWICILELTQQVVLMQSIQRLVPQVQRYDGDGMGGEPHVFFPRDAFEQYDGPTETPPPAPIEAPRLPAPAHQPTGRQLSLDFTGAA